MYIRFLFPLSLAASLVAPMVNAATPINRSAALDADGTVHVENIKGRIIVRTWAKPQVMIAGSLGKGVEKLLVEGDHNNLHIQVQYPDSKGMWGSLAPSRDVEPTLLEITVPQRASLDIDAVSADVDVAQMAGRSLSIDNVSGSINVTASSPGEADIENVSGDTTLRITTTKATVQSVSGDIRLQGGLTGEVNLESVSGNTTLVAGTLRRLGVSTVSGDASLQAGMTRGGTFKAESVSGDIVLAMPGGTSSRLHAESFSGDIESPVGKVKREEYGPGSSLDAKLGTGEGNIHVESFSGNVRLQVRP